MGFPPSKGGSVETSIMESSKVWLALNASLEYVRSRVLQQLGSCVVGTTDPDFVNPDTSPATPSFCGRVKNPSAGNKKSWDWGFAPGGRLGVACRARGAEDFPAFGSPGRMERFQRFRSLGVKQV